MKFTAHMNLAKLDDKDWVEAYQLFPISFQVSVSSISIKLSHQIIPHFPETKIRETPF